MRYLIGLLFLTFLMLVSCRERTDFEKMFMANKWVSDDYRVVDKKGNEKFCCYRIFGDDGVVHLFDLDLDREFDLLPCEEDAKPVKWRFNEKDSILSVNKTKYKLLFASRDSVSLKELTDEGTIQYINRNHFIKRVNVYSNLVSIQ